VTVPKGGGVNKLNYAYAYGEMNPAQTGGGPEMAKTVMKEISGQDIHYYVSIDFVGFRDLVNALGGVTVDVDKPINDQQYPADYFDKEGNYHKTDAYKPFVLSAGVQKLDGETALKYARSRYSTSDFDRSERQQKIIVAIKDKALSAGVLSNPKKVTEIFSILGSHIKTDISAKEYSAFIKMAKKINMSAINKLVIDNGESGLLVSDNSMNGYYLRPKTGNFKQISDIIKNIFTKNDTASLNGNSSATNVTQKATGTIEVDNASGASGQARKVGEKLRVKGMTVPAVKTSSETSNTTILYDYTGGKNADAVNIVKQIAPTAQVVHRTDGPGNIDFKLVLGKDYSGD
jgi:LCP family protein required for cell wall assembly